MRIVGCAHASLARYCNRRFVAGPLPSRRVSRSNTRPHTTRQAAVGVMTTTVASGADSSGRSIDYKNWTNERLVQRVLELEERLRANVAESNSLVNRSSGTSGPNIENGSHDGPRTMAVAAGLGPAHGTASKAEYSTVRIPSLTRDSEKLPLSSRSLPSRSQSHSENQAPMRPPKVKRAKKSFDSSKWTRRHIALKFAYLGGNYNGFEHHANNTTPLPTVEEEIWKALVRCRLIAPPSLVEHGLDGGDVGPALDKFAVGQIPVDWEGCRYSKCGRTDRGVSAFGQVIGVLVRSARKQSKRMQETAHAQAETEIDQLSEAAGNGALDTSHEPPNEEDEWMVDEIESFDPIRDELNYVLLLNRVLPPTIRMLAWCPNVPANFDARFSCKEREYRYFFTQPAYLPIPGSGTTLDIEAMREAASYLVGSHDFRNMCKIDPAKQITEFIRKIRTATVERVDAFESPQYVASARNPAGSTPPTAEAYCVRISGTAFLWHQVRCIVGLLFLVGQGYEKPDIIKQLLDIPNCPARPAYQMADDRPLVLWDCRFSATAGRLGPDDVLDRPLHDRGEGADELEWIYPGATSKVASPPLGRKWNKMGIMEDLWVNWRAAKMDEILAAQLFDVVALPDTTVDEQAVRARLKSIQIFQGEDTSRSKGTYVPVMQAKRLADVDTANAHWLNRKGPEHHRVRRLFGQGPPNGQPLDS